MVSHLVAADGGDPSQVITVDSAPDELTPGYLVSSDVDAIFGGYWCWDVLSKDVPEDELITWRGATTNEFVPDAAGGAR